MPVQRQSASRHVDGSKRNGACYLCGQLGHFRKNCKTRTATASGASVGKFENETYMEITVSGRKAACLLDTGCEKSMLPGKFVRGVQLQPNDVTVYAANGAEIPVKGKVRLRFELEGVPLEDELLVLDAIEEMMVGIYWLTQHGYHWKFDERVIIVAGRKIELQSRPTRDIVRRTYAECSVVVPARSSVDLPVKMAWNSFRAPASEWLLEPKQFRPGVYLTGVLLPQDETSSAMRILNVSSSPYVFAEDVCLGSATPAMTVESVQLPRDGDRSTRSTQEPSGSEWEPDRHLRQADRPCWREDRPLWQVDRPHWPGGQPQSQSDENYATVNAFANPNQSKHLEPVIASLPSDLSPNQRAMAERLIIENGDVFSKSDFDLGRSHLVHHRIDTGKHRPFKEQLRRHPLVHLDYIDEQVERMLKADVIGPCASPWSSNVVLAKNSDGSLRFCVDYRRLNDITYKDLYPLPRIDSCLDALGGSKYFSTMDLRSGFW